VLHDKYLFPKDEADTIASFLGPMLRLHPDKRAKSIDLIHHNWLDGVVVQGELDVIRRAEDAEQQRRRRQQQQRDGSAERAWFGAVADAMKLSEADAMKPVDDVVVLGESSEGGARGDNAAAGAGAAAAVAPPTPTHAPPQSQHHHHGRHQRPAGAGVNRAVAPASAGAKENAADGAAVGAGAGAAARSAAPKPPPRQNNRPSSKNATHGSSGSRKR
jgi:serine/threonine-protein kinase SRPK3